MVQLLHVYKLLRERRGPIQHIWLQIYHLYSIHLTLFFSLCYWRFELFIEVGHLIQNFNVAICQYIMLWFEIACTLNDNFPQEKVKEVSLEKIPHKLSFSSLPLQQWYVYSRNKGYMSGDCLEKQSVAAKVMTWQ